MGAFLNKPETKKYNESGEGNGLRYGVASMQGWRVEMEDAHHAQLTLNGTLSDWSYFAVFDGHAGARVSAHCASNLLECILQTEEFRREDIAEAIRAGFLDLDQKMRELPELSNGKEKSGSTAVCAFVSPKQIYIANCGDSRAVLARNGVPIFATRDHKPELPSEKSRIVNAGGSVMIQRVNGSLAVSRALGDYEYKKAYSRGPCEQLVSPEPEVSVHERLDSEDEFLVLACDGVWDVMSNEALCAYVHSLLQLTDDLVAITNQVIDTCLYKGSKDNMSIVLVVFPAAPKPSAEAQRADRELDDTLRARLTGCYLSLLHACSAPRAQRDHDPQTDGRADPQTDRRADPQTDGHADPQTDRRAVQQTDRHDHPQTDRRADPQTDGRADSQTDRRADPQTDQCIDPQTDGQTDP